VQIKQRSLKNDWNQRVTNNTRKRGQAYICVKMGLVESFATTGSGEQGGYRTLAGLEALRRKAKHQGRDHDVEIMVFS